MPEAEVSLLLAEHLLTREGSSGHAEVAIDGAGVQVHGKSVFDIAAYLKNRGWKPV